MRERKRTTAEDDPEGYKAVAKAREMLRRAVIENADNPAMRAALSKRGLEVRDGQIVRKRTAAQLAQEERARQQIADFVKALEEAEDRGA